MPRPVTINTQWKDHKLKIYTRPWKKSDDSVIAEVLERRTYEKNGISLPRSSHWIDCGGHIGTFALAAACEGCRVDSFEPHPDNFSLLKKNVQRNNLDDLVKMHNSALVPDRAKSIELYLAPHSTSFHSVTTPFRSGDSISVKAKNFIDFLKSHPSVDGIKMDVEGSEMPLLEKLTSNSCRRQLGCIQQLVFEWDFKHDDATARLRRVIRSLKGAGFIVKTHKHVHTKAFWDSWPSGVMVYARRPDSDTSSESGD